MMSIFFKDKNQEFLLNVHDLKSHNLINNETFELYLCFTSNFYFPKLNDQTFFCVSYQEVLYRGNSPYILNKTD